MAAKGTPCSLIVAAKPDQRSGKAVAAAVILRFEWRALRRRRSIFALGQQVIPMQIKALSAVPEQVSYDVIIIGGAIMGSSVAWFLTENPDFNGSVLVIERDPTYRNAATTLTCSCIRQQFSHPLNVQISQFTADFVQTLRQRMGNDPRVPDLKVQNFGYMYLADTEAFANVLRDNQKVQRSVGAQTVLLTAAEIAAAYPFYHLDDILLGSINRKDEGYFDGSTLFQWFRRSARERGVAYVTNEVVALTCNLAGTRVESVTLRSGQVIACGQLVNAAGTRGAAVAAMAGIRLPVAPRKRYIWIIEAETPLDRELPLTIDPTGVHMRENGGGTYMIGGHPDHDPDVDPDDFTMDHSLWQDHIWPVVATRIPAFEAVRVTSEWAGQYDFNVLDQNAIAGPHAIVSNFLFLNGFSGHGLQQSPGMGRGTAEWLTHGRYHSLDLSPLHHDRVTGNRPLIEKAII